MATATKCMSKMLKKELYEYCKTLIKENQKLQLFNNAQEQEIEELKKDLEYFQNKCEIMEKELIEEEEAEAPTPENIDKMEKLLSEKAEEYGPDFNPFNLNEEDMEEEEDFTLTFEEDNMPIVYNEKGVAIGELQEDGEVIMYSEEEED